MKSLLLFTLLPTLALAQSTADREDIETAIAAQDYDRAPGLLRTAELSNPDAAWAWKTFATTVRDATAGDFAKAGESTGNPDWKSGLRAELRAKWSGKIDAGIASAQHALKLEPGSPAAAEALRALTADRARIADVPQTATGNFAAPQVATPSPIRVGANVQAANLVSRAEPVYPPLALQARIQGTVRFSVIIDRNGGVRDLQLVSGHPLLVQPAREAVWQYRYKPTLLNGDPVEVITTVNVEFHLSADDRASAPQQ